MSKAANCLARLQEQINIGSIHIRSGYFLDVEAETEKAVKVQYSGKFHWIPKSAFVQDYTIGDDECVLFAIKEWMYRKIRLNTKLPTY